MRVLNALPGEVIMWEIHYTDGGMDYIFTTAETEAEADICMGLAKDQGLSNVRKQYVRRRKDIDG